MSPGRRPKRAISRDSGQLARAVPREPTPTGRPDHVLLPVMAAAMIAPTAMLIENPVLPQTCAAKSVAISTPRRRSGEPAKGSEVTRP